MNLFRSIQKTVFITTFLVVILISSLAVFLVYSKSSKIISDDVINFMEINMNLLNKEISKAYEQLSSIMLKISTNSELKKETLVHYNTATYEEFLQASVVRSTLDTYSTEELPIERIYLFLPDGRSYYSGSPMEKYSDLTEVAEECMKHSGLQCFTFGGNLYFSRPFLYTGNDSIAYTCILIDTEKMESAALSYQIPGAVFYAVLDDGEAVFGDGSAFERTYHVIGDRKQGTVDLVGEKFFFLSSDVNGMNLSLYNVIPYTTLKKESVKILQIAALVLFSSAVIAFFLSLVLSRYLFRDVRSLRISMLSISQGNLKTRAKVPETAEMRDLALVFNSMMDRIDDLISDAAEKEIEKQKLRQNYLSAQIQPHFVYNTLNQIRYLAIQRGEDDLAEAVAATVELLRAAIGKNREFSSICEEIEYAREYVKLSNFRTNRNIILSVYLSDEVSDLLIPTLSLQPLVENSCLHAFVGRESGNIVIEASLDEKGFVSISVADDGIGMSEAAENGGKGMFGIGLGNVFERFSLIYGEEFSYNILSKEGEGTCVSMRYQSV